jgi:hypothetical protein
VLDEFGDIGVGRAQQDILRRAALDDAPALENGDPVADLERFVEVVTDENDRLLQVFLQQQELVLQLVADQRIERRERLVHEQDVGVGGEGAREAHALLHAAGQLMAELARPLRQADHRQLFGDDLVHLRLRRPTKLEPEGDVLLHRAPWQKRELLEHHGDAARAKHPEFVGAAMSDVDRALAVADENLAPRDFVEAVHGAKDR